MSELIYHILYQLDIIIYYSHIQLKRLDYMKISVLSIFAFEKLVLFFKWVKRHIYYKGLKNI